jgi:DNA-binding HxlR family transcriptional regulator
VSATLGPMSAEIEMTGALAPRSSWGEAVHCPIARTFEVLGTKTSYLIMREAFYGATRFEEFAERTGLSEPVTAARLRELTDAGLLRREPYQDPGARTRQGYALTEMGADFLPALVALMQWGDRWLQPGGAPVELRHDGCGGLVSAELRCAHGHAGDELSAARGRDRPPA